MWRFLVINIHMITLSQQQICFTFGIRSICSTRSMKRIIRRFLKRILLRFDLILGGQNRDCWKCSKRGQVDIEVIAQWIIHIRGTMWQNSCICERGKRACVSKTLRMYCSVWRGNEDLLYSFRDIHPLALNVSSNLLSSVNLRMLFNSSNSSFHQHRITLFFLIKWIDWLLSVIFLLQFTPWRVKLLCWSLRFVFNSVISRYNSVLLIWIERTFHPRFSRHSTFYSCIWKAIVMEIHWEQGKQMTS